MSSPRYLIAKHVPDVFRKEPRNIGIVVYSDVGAETRFWGMDKYGVVDRRAIPGFVNSKSAYEQWAVFWFETIRGFSGNARFSVDALLEALQSSNRDTFFLQDAGSVLEDISADQLPGLADELFELLITSEAIDEPDTSKLINEACEKVIQQTRLAKNKSFQRHRELYPNLSPNVVEKIEFSYYYGNGEPKWLGQQVALKRYKAQLAKEVDSVCWRFDRVIRAGYITPDLGAAFVYPTPEQADDKDVIKAIEVLGTVTNVFDLSRDLDRARLELNKVADIPLAH